MLVSRPYLTETGCEDGNWSEGQNHIENNAPSAGPQRKDENVIVCSEVGAIGQRVPMLAVLNL